MPLDEELYKLAIDFAENIYKDIYLYQTGVKKELTEETSSYYTDIKNWGWFDQFNIEEEKAHNIYITIIAMTKYRHLRWKKAHPPKEKLSKWEKVVGKRARKA